MTNFDKEGVLASIVDCYDCEDSPSEVNQLSEDRRTCLVYWCKNAILDAHTVNLYNSYAIKHDFEAEGFYVTNGQFKGAMLLAGFLPTFASERQRNWRFRVRRRVRFDRDDPMYHAFSLGWFDKRYAKLLQKAQEVPEEPDKEAK